MRSGQSFEREFFIIIFYLCECRRYENLNVEDRSCFNCIDKVEDERQVLIDCPLYEELREQIFHKCLSSDNNFNTMDESEKLTFILNCNNVNLLRQCAKFCHNVLMKRRDLLYV